MMFVRIDRRNLFNVLNDFYARSIVVTTALLSGPELLHSKAAGKGR